MPYLDKEHQFYDFGTAEVSGLDVIDINKTGTSFYDDFLTDNGREYVRKKHNLKGEIQYMTPNEYFENCGKYGFPRGEIPVETLKRQRGNDTDIIEHLKEVILKYKKKFPLPYINIAERGQEGLHRFYVIGELFGWDNHKYPVLIITHADEEEAKRRELAKRVNNISNNIRYAIQDTLRYHFENFDELKDQLQWSLDDKFRFDDSIKKPVEFTIEEDPTDENYYIVKVDIGYEYIEKALIKYVEPKNSIDIEDEDLLDDDIEDFMIRYFGDDWKETHPHLKNTFNITEKISAESRSKIEDYLINNLTTSSLENHGPAIFIMSNGTIISDMTHDTIMSKISIAINDKGNREHPSFLVKEFNYIRIGQQDNTIYIELPNEKISNEQYKSLQLILDYYSSKIKLIQVDFKNQMVTYSPQDIDYIINRIKRAFTCGKLYENLYY